MRKVWVGAVTLCMASVAASCNESTVAVGGPLSLQLEADSPVRLQDSVVVAFDVVGRSLIGLILDYSDGSKDSIPFSGAQSASGTIAHRFGSTGDFTIVGVVQDAIAGDTMDELFVTIIP